MGSVFFQFCLYIALRLAHGGFTLGELALVCFGGLSLGTELLNLTRAQVGEQVGFKICMLIIFDQVMADEDAIHQNLPPPKPASHSSGCPHSRIVADWVPTFPTARVISSYSTATGPSAQISPRKA